MSQTTTQEFGKWRERLWPIHRFELKKLVPMIFMFFLILFNYTVLRDCKDAMLVSEISNLAIPVVKIFGTSLAAIAFLLVYTKLSNLLTKPKLFYASIVPFIAFFALFGLVIYPNAEAFQLNAVGNWLDGLLPSNLAYVADIIRKWPYPLFYVLAELWGTVCISLLFWGFANDITRVSEAKRVYPLFGLFGNLALMLAGPTVKLCSVIPKGWGLENARAEYTYSNLFLMLILVASAAVIVVTYWWMNKNVLSDPRYLPEEGSKKTKKSKPKMSMIESFKYLASSKYLLCLTVVVLGYGMAINLVEVTWKGQLKELYTSSSDYLGFMGMFSMMTGVATVLCMLFVGGNMMRRFGWTASALFTPVMLLVTGVAFFGFVLFKDSLTWMTALMGVSPLFLSVMIGAGQNVLSKASKYSLFDPTKEMAYIPLDQEQKVKGKAAIDVAGARLGKSGGSALQIGLTAVPFLAANYVSCVAALVTFVVVAWIVAAKSLGRQFGELTDQQAAEATAAKAEPAVDTEGAAPAGA